METNQVSDARVFFHHSRNLIQIRNNFYRLDFCGVLKNNILSIGCASCNISKDNWSRKEGNKISIYRAVNCSTVKKRIPNSDSLLNKEIHSLFRYYIDEIFALRNLDELIYGLEKLPKDIFRYTW